MSFHLITDDANRDLKYFVPDILKHDKISAAFTTRLGGVSGEDLAPLKSLNLAFKSIDKDENVLRNYEVMANALKFDPQKIITLHQRHTDKIIVCDRKYIFDYSFPAKDIADAVITNIKGVLLSVKVADCTPILFYDEKNGAVGAAHCGWRGTLQKLQKKTVQKMTEVYGSSPDDIKAAIGACISLCCYEVTADFFKEFRNRFGDSIEQFFQKKSDEKYHCDLKGINRRLLTESGIKPENIEVSDSCTFCEKKLFFSHRRDGEMRGTLAAFIGLC